MKRLLAGILIALALLTGCGKKASAVPEPPAAPEEEAWLCMLDVGKGDAILIRAGGKTYLVDTGKKDRFDTLERAFAYFGIERLDGVFLTHADSDHAGGLTKLAKSGTEVGAWYASAFWDGGKKKHPAVKAAEKRGEEAVLLNAGDTVDGLFTVLGPLSESDNEDDNSLVMRLSMNGVSVLLAGDMEYGEEEELLDAGACLAADVLKVPNHGDDDTCSGPFLQAVRPKIALISTDPAEKPGTPDPLLLASLEGAGISVYRTDGDGHIMLDCSGGGMEISFPAF